jgi:hypothetical protein
VRILAILLALTATAAADPARDVDKLVRSFLGNLHNRDKLATILRPDAMYSVGDTIARDATPDDVSTFSGTFDIRSVSNIAVTFDPRRHAAWFRGVADAIAVDQTGDSCMEGNCPPMPEFQMHVAGLAVDDHGWKLAAMIVTETEDDRVLVNRHAEALFPVTLPDAPELTGDPKLAGDAVAWFHSGLAHGAAPAFVYVSGTAPRELAAGTASKRLVDKWDSLKLVLASVDAKTYGEVGFVFADVRWPFRANHVVPMRLAAIAIRDGARWLWVVLDFA